MTETTLQGSCLCGAVQYEVTGEPERMYHCHCGRCRKASGAGHATNLMIRPGSIRWIQGEDTIKQGQSTFIANIRSCLYQKECDQNKQRAFRRPEPCEEVPNETRRGFRVKYLMNLLGGSKCSLLPIYFVDAMMSAIGWKIPYSNGSNPGIMQRRI